MKKKTMRNVVAILCLACLLVGNLNITSHAGNTYTVYGQPTPEDPTFYVSAESCSYQWYTATEKKSYLTSNGKYPDGIWSSNSSGKIYCELVQVKKGVTLVIVPQEGFSGEVKINSKVQEPNLYGEIVYVVSSKSDITVSIQGNEGCESYTCELYTLSYTICEPLAGETQKTLQHPVIDQCYMCKATVGGGEEVSSISFKMRAAVCEEPTYNEWTFRTNSAEECTYQWYKVKQTVSKRIVGSSDEVQSDEVNALSVISGTYEDGKWTSEDGCISLKMSVKKGQQIVVVPEEGFDGQIGVSSHDDADVFVNTDGVYVYNVRASSDLQFGLYDYGNKPFKATVYIIIDKGIQMAEGENEATLKEPEYNQSYVCQATFPNGVVAQSAIVTTSGVIYSQPTAADPTYSFNFEEKSSFQWYLAEKVEQITIVGEDVEAKEGEQNATIYEGRYEDGKVISYGSKIYVTFMAKAGQQVVFVPEDDFYGYVMDFDNRIEFTYVDGVYVFNVLQDGEFSLYSEGYCNDGFSAEIYLVTYETGELLDGETKPTLQQPIMNEAYICKATVETGEELQSSVVVMRAAAVTQPTEENPTFEVNMDERCSYQWYKAAVTDIDEVVGFATTVIEGEQVRVSEVWPGTWDGDCWSGDYIQIYCFARAGQVFEFVPDEAFDGKVGIMFTNEYYYKDGDSYIYIPQVGNHVYTVANNASNVEYTAHMYLKTYGPGELLEGETGKTLQNMEKNELYICKATYPNGEEVLSCVLRGVTQNPFNDVDSQQYYYKPVLWAVESGTTAGLTATTFGPNKACTRAEIVTFLWRALGKQVSSLSENPFDDVPADIYYEEAVLWAYENGITVGVSETMFAPDKVCTRAEVVSFLWRAMGRQAADDMSTSFKDVPADIYYAEAVAWAVENGITYGLTENTFGPEQNCTRAEVVTFLYRVLGEE